MLGFDGVVEVHWPAQLRSIPSLPPPSPPPPRGSPRWTVFLRCQILSGHTAFLYFDPKQKKRVLANEDANDGRSFLNSPNRGSVGIFFWRFFPKKRKIILKKVESKKRTIDIPDNSGSGRDSSTSCSSNRSAVTGIHILLLTVSNITITMSSSITIFLV